MSSKDISDIISAVTNLSNRQTESRDKELKLIQKIINNILSNPDQPKYQYLNKTKLLNKLSNQTIWIELLMNAGFNESQDGNQLIFDSTKLLRLENVNDMLLLHEGRESDKKNNDKQVDPYNFETMKKDFSHIQNKINQLMSKQASSSDVKCICGETLRKGMNSSLLYDGYGASCDICAGNQGIFWHCDHDNDDIHSDGFDICDNCANNYDDISNKMSMMMNQIDKINDMKESLEQLNDKLAEEDLSCDIVNCQRLKRLIRMMDKYETNNYNVDTEVIDDFLHLMNNHKTDEEFEFIVNQFPVCDINQCQMFLRNNRDRNGANDHHSKTICNYCTDIMDKIHCCFMHCFDIGNRLSMEDKLNIENEQNTNDIDENESIINTKILSISKILSDKRVKIKNNSQLNNRMNKRYNQLFVEEKKQNKDNVSKSDGSKKYSFGHKFKYGYTGEHKHEMASYVYEAIIVRPKYESLKEEMTSNGMTMPQFDNEFKKANIHFNSYYR